MQLIKRPILLAILAIILWLAAHQLGGVEQKELLKADETIMTSGFITTLTVIVALLAAAVFTKVWTEWSEVRNSLKEEKSEKTFNKYVDERIPPTVKSAIIILFFSLLGAFYILSVASIVTGVYMVGSITFALSFYWEVLMDLDDYWTGAWNIDIRDVPDEWEWAEKNKKRIMRKLGYK